MNHSILFLSFFFIFFVASSSSFNHTIHKCSKQQSDALLLFKQTLSSSIDHDSYLKYLCQEHIGSRHYPITRNWNTHIDCCNWNGVTCDRFTGNVIGLDLSCGLLRGNIHPNTTLFQLHHLQRLNLAYNDFTGSNFLPQVIGRFASSLTHLNISDCWLAGQIPPEISFLPKLVSLDLSWNALQIQPYVFNNLLQNSTHLRELVIAGFNMDGWVLPTYLNTSYSLKTLDLHSNGLQGKLPHNIFCLPYLEKLDLSDNNDITISLTKVNKSASIPLKWLDLSNTNSSLGEIPYSIFHLKSLNYLCLSSCGVSGSLPESLINLRHLITLDLSRNMLNGTLPSFLFTFPFLQNLRLSDNMFRGVLPIELFNQRSLRKLDLFNNQFDGEINVGSTPPSSIQLTNLISLDLSYNSFRGLWDLDTLLSSSPNLIYLDLSYSGLSIMTRNATSHANPDFLILRLASCKLTVFPESLRAMKRLEYLDLSGNDIEGYIPNWAEEIGRNDLSYLDLSYNSIIGLPQFQWKRLKQLFLQSNKIQGTFPPSICNMSELWDLDISNNSFSGVIPQCVENINILNMINLGTNHFYGTIPNMCKHNQGFGRLLLNENQLEGAIPTSLSNCSYLRVLDVRNNHLNGTIPNMCMDKNELDGLLVNGNQLEGAIPTSLSNCSFLRVIDLGNNRLNGTFPNRLGDLHSLEVLVLKSNDFHGSIDSFSSTEFPFPLLQVLDLSNNQFVGNLPQRYFQNLYGMKDIERNGSTPGYLNFSSGQSGYYSITTVVKGHELVFAKLLVDYTIIDLSNNNFEGEIPNVIGSLNSLIVLNLSHNNLNGQIPHDLTNLLAIESLDLSSNKLTGRIPQGLVDITTLEVLNLSQNDLEGRIPEGKQFNTFDQSSYWGNPKLCGAPLPKHCEPHSFPPLFHVDGDEDEEESVFRWKVVMLGYGCGTIVGLLMGCVMLSTGRPKWFNSIVDVGERMIQIKQKRRRYVYIGK